MRRLFIIGNGFDLTHGLPTGYDNFHKYLKDLYPDVDEDTAYVPMSATGNHGEELYAEDEVAGYLMHLLSRTDGGKWSDFENMLGRLDFDDDFFDLPEEYDRDGDRNLWHEAANNEALATQLAGCVPQIKDFFAQWVDSIAIDIVDRMKNDCKLRKCVKSFQALIDPALDQFFVFNYTKVLETVYDVSPDKICHIHGCQGEPIVVGHGAGPLFNEDHGSPYIGSESGLEYIQDVLRKDSSSALQAHRGFFEGLADGVEEICVYGFSFGQSDHVYLQEMFKRLDTRGIKCYLHSHECKDWPVFKEALVGCGFQGMVVPLIL